VTAAETDSQQRKVLLTPEKSQHGGQDLQNPSKEGAVSATCQSSCSSLSTFLANFSIVILPRSAIAASSRRCLDSRRV
jgi:hypothetical protein